MSVLSSIKRILSLVIFIPVIALSQASLKGTVTDAANNETLIGVNVVVMGTSLGAATDIEGQFRIVGIPARVLSVKYSCIGYEPQVKEIDFSKTNDVVLDAKLKSVVIQGEEVVVTAQMRGQIAAINQQVSSNTIVNVVSEEKIKELPDANAAEAIGRLPGVSIIRSGGEANKIILRGLEDKFTNITIDGVKIPPTDATSRGVDLSMLSQSSLAGIELYKALTPDKDGDAIAGSINFVTRKAPEEREIRADLKGNYNALMKSMNQYDFALHYGERFFDNFLGVQLTGNIEKKIRSNERINVNYGDQDKQTTWFVNDFLLEFTDEVRKRDGLSLLLDFNTPDNGTIRISNVFGNTSRNYLWSSRDYPSNGGGSQNGNPVFDYRDREQDIKTFNSSIRGDNHLLGLTINWGASFAQSQADYPYDYEAIFWEPSGMLASSKVQTNPEQLISYAVNNFSNASLYWTYFRTQDNLDKERTAFIDLSSRYTIGDIFSGELKMGGKYKSKNRSNERNENHTPYYLGRWQRYELLPDGTFRLKDFTGTNFEEWLKGGGGFIGLDQFLPNSQSNRNIYDAYNLNPLISREKLRKWQELNKYGIDVTKNEKEIWVNELIKYDDYFTTERVTSAYLMNTLNIGQTLTIIAGVRIEKETNDYNSTYMPKMVSGFPIPENSIADTTSSYSQTIVLPNINISIKPIEIMNIRMAVYKALARPDFNMRLNRYIAGRPAEASTQFQVYVGNTALKSSQAWNYEINTSISDNTIGLISLSAYYKEIDDMYHMLNNFNVTTGNDSILLFFGSKWKSQMGKTPYNLTLPYNSPKPTKVWGFEFEHQMNFSFLPGLLKNIVLSYNTSIVRSEAIIYGSRTITYIDSSGIFKLTKSKNILVEEKRKLEGMPEFFANVSLGYDIGGFSARVSMFHQAEHNVAYSANGLSDQVTNAITRFDCAIKQKITDYLSVFLNINNITNIEDGTHIHNSLLNRDLFDQSEKYGTTADLGVTIEL